MKLLYSALLICTGFIASSQPNTLTSLSELKLKGKVKTITLEKLEAIQEKELNDVVIGRVSSMNNFRIQFFNADGVLEKEELYTADRFSGEKVLNHLLSYEYEEGRLMYHLNGDVQGQKLNAGYKGIEYRYQYESDSVMLILCQDPHSLHSRYTYSKNEHTFERLFKDMKVHSTEKTLFDVYGRKILFTVLSSEGDPTSLTQWFYAGENDPNPVRLLKSDVKTSSNTICQYQYNHLNQYISAICREHSGNTERIYSYQYEYNDHGDLISESSQESPGNHTKTKAYQFKYDHQGNWIEKKFFDNSSHTGLIHRRNITYWEE